MVTPPRLPSSRPAKRTWRYIAASWRTTAEESIEIVKGASYPSDGELLVPAVELAVANVELGRLHEALHTIAADTVDHETVEAALAWRQKLAHEVSS